MQRASIFLIHKKDLGKLVRRKRCGQIIEYWIYKGRRTNLLLPNGRRYIDENDMKLDSIIACEEDHIVKDNKDNFTIVGLKFYKDDLEKYISYRDKIK